MLRNYSQQNGHQLFDIAPTILDSHLLLSRRFRSRGRRLSSPLSPGRCGALVGVGTGRASRSVANRLALSAEYRA